MANKLTVTRRIAPEDLRQGMFVVVISHIHEYFPTGLIESALSAVPEPIRYPCLDCADGTPLRVLVVCLPFVHAEGPDGALKTIDTRTRILASVSEEYALEAFTRPKAG
ncbi:MAG: hypothetical protein GIKADHBN_00593 [Phycisphaerales bacterium]|nr:hypothetical protein [Phycisphaerales bacterium]MCK6475894.1 hypothetical protein [Phycisphaerales bacterium]